MEKITIFLFLFICLFLIYSYLNIKKENLKEKQKEKKEEKNIPFIVETKKNLENYIIAAVIATDNGWKKI